MLMCHGTFMLPSGKINPKTVPLWPWRNVAVNPLDITPERGQKKKIRTSSHWIPSQSITYGNKITTISWIRTRRNSKGLAMLFHVESQHTALQRPCHLVIPCTQEQQDLVSSCIILYHCSAAIAWCGEIVMVISIKCLLRSFMMSQYTGHSLHPWCLLFSTVWFPAIYSIFWILMCCQPALRAVLMAIEWFCAYETSVHFHRSGTTAPKTLWAR